MLYYKHGTLAEERFKNLTDLQWLVHFYEIIRMKELEAKEKDSRQQEVVSILKATWLAIDPERGKKLMDILKQDTIEQDDKQPTEELTPDNFKEKWAEIMTFMPQSIVPPKEVTAAKLLVMPSVSRKEFIEGISIEE